MNIQKKISLSSTKETQNDTCDNIKVRDTINFRIQLEATHCGVNREQVIAIGPAGLSDILILRVNIICDCDCESEPNPVGI